MMTFRSAEARLLLLGGAALAVIVSLVSFVSAGLPTQFVGWLFGGAITTTLVAINRSATTNWSARTGRVPPRWQTIASVSLVAFGFALSVLHASSIAWELS